MKSFHREERAYQDKTWRDQSLLGGLGSIDTQTASTDQLSQPPPGCSGETSAAPSPTAQLKLWLCRSVRNQNLHFRSLLNSRTPKSNYDFINLTNPGCCCRVHSCTNAASATSQLLYAQERRTLFIEAVLRWYLNTPSSCTAPNHDLFLGWIITSTLVHRVWNYLYTPVKITHLTMKF